MDSRPNLSLTIIGEEQPLAAEARSQEAQRPRHK